MAVRIGMNGFGRIGRYLTRLLMEEPDLELVGFNARADNATYAHMFKYDSVFGTYKGEVKADDEGMTIDGNHIKVTRWPNPSESKWADENVDIVVEATGAFKDRDSLSQHMKNGAKKVVMSAPAKKPDISIVYGVNEGDYDPDKHHIIDAASCTTNCLAPVAKVLHDNFGIKHGLMTTIHSYTMSQRILDGSHKDLRRARAAAVSMIPTTTGAAKAVTRVIPALEGKLDGMAVRVPTPDGSLVDLVCELEKSTSAEEVNKTFKDNADEVLGYSDEPLVSCDYIGDSHGGVVDGLTTSVIGDTMCKVLAWYDNEAGYTHQLLRVIKMAAKNL
jgi:glyceraldehyde 3-phosphate dehydrogenase